MKNIERYLEVINRSLFLVTGKLDYDRLTDAVIKLANAVHDFDGDTDDLWAIGESGECSLSDFIVGAYWHYTDWHSGQDSKSYAALSALGQVFSPGTAPGVEVDAPEYDAYRALQRKAQAIPPDPDGMNAERERWAYCAMLAFQRQTLTDDGDLLADLLCDLQHWASRNGFDFDNELRRANLHFEEETEQ